MGSPELGLPHEDGEGNLGHAATLALHYPTGNAECERGPPGAMSLACRTSPGPPMPGA